MAEPKRGENIPRRDTEIEDQSVSPMEEKQMTAKMRGKLVKEGEEKSNIFSHKSGRNIVSKDNINNV